jgi:hypothetical protein
MALLAAPMLLAGGPAQAACTPQELSAFEQAVHRTLACGLADRLLSEEGCESSPVPECGAAALEQLAELVPGGFGDSLLSSWGYSGALCRAALARASELFLHELLTQPLREAAEAPAHPHASRGGRPAQSGQPSGDGEESEAQQAMSDLEQVCDSVEVGLRSIVGGSCAMLGQWGDILDGPRLRGCITQGLGRIAEEVRPGSSAPRSGHAGRGRPGRGQGRPGEGGPPDPGRPGAEEQGGRSAGHP